ncbi:hypothetical protein BDP27DRAFT_1432999 [Rhodocollybia butyracea]|uniref:C2H2-type domain-containing protein n=1 Tax=Rhodocollybia butyracea TaxID=206335 RepID=A0A9P5P7E3_9AGAR|nr:hypothetical protein BDP27DRAFT_1432999 [Rhodocollybia butyracea]
MGRLNTEEELDDKKETTTAKRKSAAKKSISTAVWPCQIDGCTKQFAREADLKRHQRTTKLHSMAGYSCPQCEATFTRTDALKRHQKSRHNGAGFDELEDFAQSSQDSGATIASSSKQMLVIPEIVQGRPSASGPATGVSSYYRPDDSPPHVASTRTVAGSNVNQTAYMYTSSFSSAVVSASPHQGATSPLSSSAHPEDNLHSSPSTSSSHSHQIDTEELHSPSSHLSPAQPTQIPAPIPPLPPPVQLERLLLEAEAARTAELSSSEDHCSQESFPVVNVINRQWSLSPAGGTTSDGDHSQDSASSSIANDESPASVDSLHEHEYGLHMTRPEPMESILTENGEPMLNPAELLTQVGWGAVFDGPDSVSDDARSTSSHESSPDPS